MTILDHPTAALSAAKALEARWLHKRCDSEAVASCNRCQSVFLARFVQAALDPDTDHPEWREHPHANPTATTEARDE